MNNSQKKSFKAIFTDFGTYHQKCPMSTFKPPLGVEIWSKKINGMENPKKKTFVNQRNFIFGQIRLLKKTTLKKANFFFFKSLKFNLGKNRFRCRVDKLRNKIFSKFFSKPVFFNKSKLQGSLPEKK